MDGFNLYYGIRSKGWRRYYWLDIASLARKLLISGDQLAHVRYFTSRLRGGDSSKQRRQLLYLEALNTLPQLEIEYGHFLTKSRKCNSCGETWSVYEEKMTDVNIAVRLLEDAQDNEFDKAIVISADSDLASPIESVIRRHQDKQVVVAFPPNRRSDQLRATATETISLGRKMLSKSQFPAKVQKDDGFVLDRPAYWH